MACACHGKMGVAVRSASPEDQCTTCARKHVKNAWGAWHEFTYEEDNRDFVSDQLRKAADHLKFDHRETALKCRDLAIVVEEVRDLEHASVAEMLASLNAEVRDLYYADHPDARERLEELARRSARLGPEKS